MITVLGCAAGAGFAAAGTLLGAYTGNDMGPFACTVIFYMAVIVGILKAIFEGNEK